MNTLEIRDLRKSYPGFTLGPLSLTLPGGCILGLIGENGAGKSTTIRLVLNALERDAGSITVLGRDNLQQAREIKEEVGVVWNEVGIPGAFTAEQVGRIMGDIYRQWDGGEYKRLLRRLEVPERKAFKDFSQGMRMKLGIAIALSHHARLLLLDEPTNGLDPVVREEVVELLREFASDEERSVLISSHIVSDLEKLCDYVAFLHKGELLVMEEKDVLLGEYAMTRAAGSDMDTLPRDAVLHRRDHAFGSEAIVRRDALPHGWPQSPVSMEELFVHMVKEESV